MLNLKFLISVMFIKLTFEHCPKVVTVCKLLIKKILTLKHMPQENGMYKCNLKSNTCPYPGIIAKLQNIQLVKKDLFGALILMVKFFYNLY